MRTDVACCLQASVFAPSWMSWGCAWLLQVLQADKSSSGISLPGDDDALAATAQFLVGAADIIDRGAGELSTVKVDSCVQAPALRAAFHMC